MLHVCNTQFIAACNTHRNIYVTCMLFMHAICMYLACYTYVAYIMHTCSAYMLHVCHMYVFFSRVFFTGKIILVYLLKAINFYKKLAKNSKKLHFGNILIFKPQTNLINHDFSIRHGSQRYRVQLLQSLNNFYIHARKTRHISV